MCVTEDEAGGARVLGEGRGPRVTARCPLSRGSLDGLGAGGSLGAGSVPALAWSLTVAGAGIKVLTVGLVSPRRYQVTSWGLGQHVFGVISEFSQPEAPKLKDHSPLWRGGKS